MATLLDRLREAALAFRLRRFSRVRWTDFEGETAPDTLPGTIRFYELLIKEARRLASDLPDPHLLVDIGCADWSYLPALAKGFPRAVRIIGFEADPGRLYWTGLTRGHLADVRAKQISADQKHPCEVLFVPGDFLRSPLPWSPPVGAPPSQSLFTAFFPFVSEAPARAWGLPGRFADFNALLERVRSFSIGIDAGRPASLLTVHQGEWEDEIADRILREARWETRASRIECARFQSDWPGKHDVFVRFSKGPSVQK